MKEETKKLIKFIILFVTLNIIITYFFNNISFGATSCDVNEWKPHTYTGEGSIVVKGNRIIGAVRSVGSIVSVVSLIVLGIKYMIGSVEEKAEYKKTMIPYVVGAIMVFAISNILSVLYNFVSTW